MAVRSVLALVAVFTLVACSPGPGQPATQTTDPDTTTGEEGSSTPTTTTPPATSAEPGTSTAGTGTSATDDGEVDDLAVAYLTALADADPARRQDAVEATVPGSPANAYARVQVAQARAIREQDLEQSDAEVRRSADVVALCYGDVCATYSGFVVEGQPPRLVTFDIQGSPLAERVVAGDGVEPATSGPVTVELVGALHATTEESTVIAFEVRNLGDVTLDVALYLSEYVGPGGETHPVRDAIGPSEVEPNATATAIIVFERTELGGTLTVEASTDEDRHSITITVPRP